MIDTDASRRFLVVRLGWIATLLAAISVAGGVLAGDAASGFALRAKRVIEESFSDRDCQPAGNTLVCGDVNLGLDNLERKIAEVGAEGEVIDAMILQFFGLAWAEVLQDQSAAASQGVQARSETDQANRSDAARGDAKDWQAAAPKLRPQLVPTDYRKQLGKKNVESFLPGILIATAVDEPDRYQFVLDRHLKAWDVTQQDIRRRALANLTSIAATLELGATPPEDPELPGAWLSISEDDGYAAARVVVPSVRARIAELLGETYFIAFPNRDFLVAWSRDFAFHLDFMTRVREDFESRHHPLSPDVFIGSATEIREATAAELASGVRFGWSDDNSE